MLRHEASNLYIRQTVSFLIILIPSIPIFAQILRAQPQSDTFSNTLMYSMNLILAKFIVLMLLNIAASMSIMFGRLEFREKGMCFMYSFMTWDKMQSYKWDTNKPHLLRINVKAHGIFLFPTVTSLKIPLKFKESLDTLLSQHLVRDVQ